MPARRGFGTACGLVVVLYAAYASAGARPDFGALEVNSELEAPIYIEGVLVGPPPVNISHLEPGRYRLVVRRAEAGDLVQDVSVEAGAITTVDPARTAASDRGRSYCRDEADWAPLLDAHRRRYEKASVSRRLRAYRTLEIGNFLVKTDELAAYDALFTLLPRLAERLDRRARFAHFVTNYTRGPSERWIDPGQAPSEPTVVLSGVLTRFEHSKKRVRVYGLFRLVDKESGAVLLERMENGSVGSDSRDAFEELADDIARVIERSW